MSKIKGVKKILSEIQELKKKKKKTKKEQARIVKLRQQVGKELKDFDPRHFLYKEEIINRTKSVPADEGESISKKVREKITKKQLDKLLKETDNIPFSSGGDVNIENLIGKRPNKQRPSPSERMRKPRNRSKMQKSEKEMRRHLTGTVASEFTLTPADRYMKGRPGKAAPMKKSEVMKKRKGM